MKKIKIVICFCSLICLFNLVNNKTNFVFENLICFAQDGEIQTTLFFVTRTVVETSESFRCPTCDELYTKKEKTVTISCPKDGDTLCEPSVTTTKSGGPKCWHA